MTRFSLEQCYLAAIMLVAVDCGPCRLRRLETCAISRGLWTVDHVARSHRFIERHVFHVLWS